MYKDDVIKTLVDLGLSTGEAKTYVALTLEGSSEATPLAQRAGIAQPKIYEYLKSLKDRNFINVYETKTRAKSYSSCWNF